MDDWVTGIVESMGYVGIALLMALENVFPPIPSEVIMPLAGFTASQGEVNLWVTILVGTIGALVGALPWYGLARWLDNEKVYAWVGRHGHWLTVDCDELKRAECWFTEHGRSMVALGRLVPGIRTLISVPAGFCKMPLPRFLAYSAIGTLVWTGVLAYLGHLLGQKYTQVSTYLGPVTWGVIGVIFVVYLVRLVRMRRRNHARRREADGSHVAGIERTARS